MPVRSQGQLLAGLGALLGLVTAGGCQTHSLYGDPVALQATNTKVVINLPRFSLGRPTPSTTTQAGPAIAYTEQGSAAGAVRPATNPTFTETDNTSVIASSWHKVERVGGEPVAEPRPLPVSMVPPSGTQRTSLELNDAGQPVTIATTSRNVTAEEPPTQLHMPSPSGVPPTAMVAPLVPMPVHEGHEGHEGHDAHYPPPVPREGAKQALPPYVVEPPDVLLIQATKAITGKDAQIQPLDGPHLVRPDGFISLGVYGDVFVAGMTLQGVRDAIAQQLKRIVKGNKDLSIEQIEQELRVDVLSYNSKAYYVITNGGGYGEQIYRVPITGNETVLDALSYVQGLPAVASLKRIWLARANHADPHHPIVLPIDYKSVTRLGSVITNYQIYPGDRIFVDSDPWIKTDSWLAKRFSPLERILGITLLGSSTVNSITRRGGQ